MLHALIPFLIFLLILAVIVWVIFMALDWVPVIPANIKWVAKAIVGVIAFIMILDKALPLLGYSGAF